MSFERKFIETTIIGGKRRTKKDTRRTVDDSRRHWQAMFVRKSRICEKVQKIILKQVETSIGKKKNEWEF